MLPRVQGIESVFAAYADRIAACFFDAEAFHARMTDFAVLDTEGLRAYYFLIEELRDSPPISQGCLAFSEIFLGVQDGFQEYERTRTAMEAAR